MYEDWDLLFVLEGGKRLLDGGNYLNQLFETNPPLIFYLGAIINRVAEEFALDKVLIFKLVIYSVVLYSLVACHYLLKNKLTTCRTNDKSALRVVNPHQLVSPNRASAKSGIFSLPVQPLFEGQFLRCLLIVLAISLLLLPARSFGEREHLMIALVLPYFFLRYESLQNIHFNFKIRGLISLLAAWGFALKPPYFLFAWVAGELQLAFWQKSWCSLFCLENSIILLFSLGYFLSIAFYMPSYFAILPFIVHFYAANSSVSSTLASPQLINLLLLMGGYFLLPSRSFSLEKLIIVIACAFALSFMLQGKNWYYHSLPLLTANSLLAALLIYRFYQLKNNALLSIVGATLLGGQFLFSFTVTFSIYHNNISCYKKESCVYQPLIRIAKQHAENQAIYFFTTLMSTSIPIIYYANTLNASRFSAMWPLSGIVNRENKLKHCDKPCREAKNAIRQFIIEDFERHDPKLVFVDVTPSKAYFKSPFDYLEFMHQESKFKALWQRYCYFTTCNNYAIYKRCS